MPTNITYKGSILTTVNNNQAKVLKTSGKYLEDDITVSSALNLQGKTTSITPNTSTQTTTISPDSGYEGLSGVTITVNPIPSQYIIPAGTITITSNGTHDVSQYADASVNVLPYTATLTGDAGGDNSYVRHNNRQYTSGTFKFTGGDELYICSEGLRGGGNIYINNRLITSSSSRAEYTYTLPNNDIEISFTRGQTSYVYITVSEITITQNGQHDVGSYAIANVNVDAPTPSLQNKTVVPSETTQSITADTGYSGLGTVTVNGITNTYVGSSVPAGSLTVSGPTVTASAGYYANATTYTMPYAVTPTTRPEFTTPTPTITIDSNGLITSESIYNSRLNMGFTFITSPGYIDAATPRLDMDLKVPSGTLQLPVQAAATITPSSATQTITGQKYMTGDITVQPIPSQYIAPSGTLTITSVDTTTTFDATSYASVAVNLKDADVTAY